MGGGGCWRGPENLGICSGMINLAVWKYSSNLTYPQDCLTVKLSHWCWQGKDRKQANIQGIHCIIKTTTGIRRWGLWICVVLFARQNNTHFQSVTSWPVSSPTTFSLCVFPTPVPQMTHKHSEHVTLTTSQMYSTLPCIHSGQRLQFLSLLIC